MMIYQVGLFGKVGVHGYNQVKKHKTNVTLHSRFSEWVYFVTDGTQYNFGANCLRVRGLQVASMVLQFLMICTFDVEWRKGALNKLQKVGTTNNLLSVFSSFLPDRF